MNLFFRVRLYMGFLLVLRRFSLYLFCEKCNVWEMDNENIKEIYKISIFFMGSLFFDVSYNYVYGLLLFGKLFILK